MERMLDVNGFSFCARYADETVRTLFLPLLRRLQKKIESGLERQIVFLAGPPALGTSALAWFLAALASQTPGMPPVQALGMDGFHYRQEDLLRRVTFRNGEEISLARIKGAPETFDVEGLRVALCALRDGKSVSWPLYDRRLHDVVENALYASAPILLVEGNWLLLDAPAWQGLPHDWAIFLSAEESQLRERLIARKMRGGRTEAEARAFYDACDGPNVRLCLQRRLPADEQWRMLDTGRFARE